MQKQAQALQPGDLVDLQDDTYADKNKCPAFEYEYQIVEAVERETHCCVAVHFEGGPVIGFPPEHLLRVSGEKS